MVKGAFQGAWIALALLFGYMFAWWLLNVVTTHFTWPQILLTVATSGAIWGILETAFPGGGLPVSSSTPPPPGNTFE